MTRIKIVPNATPDADGEWIDIPVDFPCRTRWTTMESLVVPFVPADHHVVAVERGSQSSYSITKGPKLAVR
jgi:hypothetical protein